MGNLCSSKKKKQTDDDDDDDSLIPKDERKNDNDSDDSESIHSEEEEEEDDSDPKDNYRLDNFEPGSRNKKKTLEKPQIVLPSAQEEERKLITKKNKGRPMTTCGIDSLCFFWIPYIFTLLTVILTIISWIGNGTQNFGASVNITEVNSTGAYVTTTLKPNILFLAYETVHLFLSCLVYFVYFDSYWDGIRRQYNPWKFAELALGLPLIVVGAVALAKPNMSYVYLIVVGLAEFLYVLICARIEYSVSLPMHEKYPPSFARNWCRAKRGKLNPGNKNTRDFVMCALYNNTDNNGLNYMTQQKQDEKKSCFKSFPCFRKYDAYGKIDPKILEKFNENHYIGIEYAFITVIYLIFWFYILGSAQTLDSYNASMVYSTFIIMITVHILLATSLVTVKCYYWSELLLLILYDTYGGVLAAVMTAQILK